MSAFATWLAGHRIRRIVIIAGLFPLPLLGLVSAATVVMAAYLRGAREAVLDCVLALVLLAALGFAAGMDVAVLAGSAALSWGVWLLLGAVAGRSSSLTLAIQAAVLLALAGMAVFLLAVGDPVAFWLPVLEAWYADLGTQGLTLPEGADWNAALLRQSQLMSGGLFAFTLSGSLLALLLGVSWAGRVSGGAAMPATQGFRELRLGYVIGGLAAIAGLLSLIGVELHGALLVFGVAFTYQGAAVLAWWARQLGWPRSWWLAPVIAPLLFMGLLVVELAILATMGFVDNWFSLRRVPRGPEER